MGEVGGAEHPAALRAEGDRYPGEVHGGGFCGGVCHFVWFFGLEGRMVGCVDASAISYVLIMHGLFVDVTDLYHEQMFPSY